MALALVGCGLTLRIEFGDEREDALSVRGVINVSTPRIVGFKSQRPNVCLDRSLV